MATNQNVCRGASNFAARLVFIQRKFPFAMIWLYEIIRRHSKWQSIFSPLMANKIDEENTLQYI